MNAAARILSLRLSVAFVAVLLVLAPQRASAFCGFYVAGTDTALHNHATTVVLMRDGTHTVLSMQNDYAGPPEDFAMIVPVPTVLRETDVRTLPREVFATIERLSGPRLVEYWEADPCGTYGTIGLGSLGTIGHGAGYGSGSGYGAGAGAFVRVEAEFAVGEYDIVVLGTNDSSALEIWLRTNGYHVPLGAAAALRPYVEAGTKFFVARVDVDRVHFEDGRAVLSPLRVHYESDTFSLPVRLGLLNSAGTQDLVVAVLARDQRYEVANYPNIFIPTNLDVADGVRERFSDFYGALFDRALEANPGAVVTEYAWQVTSCDPCPPDTAIDAAALMTLGGDVLYRDGVSPPFMGGMGFGYGRGTTATVNLERPSVEGGLSVELVRRVLRRHVAELRFCYEQQLTRFPNADGTIEASFTVTETGSVADAAVTAVDGDLTEAVLTCARTAFARWTFPAPDGGGVVHITQRVLLTSGAVTEAGTAVAAPAALPATVSAGEFVLTRLHYRYGRDGLSDDLVFRPAEAVVGGREIERDGGGLEEGATASPANNFQARYVIRHAWEGAIECESPVRGIWGGPPEGDAPPIAAAPAHGDRAAIELASLVRTAVPSLGLTAGASAAPPSAAVPLIEPAPPAPAAAAPAVTTGACGCRAARRHVSVWALLGGAALCLGILRRSSRRVAGRARVCDTSPRCRRRSRSARSTR